MERYIGLGTHGKSCTFGVIGAQLKRIREAIEEYRRIVEAWAGKIVTQ